MNNGSSLKGTAIALGVAGLALIAVGVVLLVTSDDSGGDPMAGILIRSGAVLGAAALVIPNIRKPSPTTLVLAGGGAVLVLLRPALVWVALAVWLGWLIWGRQRRTSSKES